jgi:fused signal recognition particle receptor
MGDTKPGLLGRLRAGLGRTRERLGSRLSRLVGGRAEPSVLDELEEALIEADVGPATAERLVDALRRHDPAEGELRQALAREITAILEAPGVPPPLFPLHGLRPRVWLLVGVNGSGKTTTAGKLALLARAQGLKALLVAADTFRAAASEQLHIWAERAGVDCVGSREGADPASVVFDGLSAARARGVDVVIVDTAGRLHTKANLMQELAKVARVAGKAIEGAPHECLLVVDGTTGRNTLNQAREFASCMPLTGFVLTKLDGTARGGAVISAVEELGVSPRYLGVGESPEDLTTFSASAFTEALLGD